MSVVTHSNRFKKSERRVIHLNGNFSGFSVKSIPDEFCQGLCRTGNRQLLNEIFLSHNLKYLVVVVFVRGRPAANWREYRDCRWPTIGLYTFAFYSSTEFASFLDRIRTKRDGMWRQTYEEMTHYDILRVHGARYAQMTPDERAKQSEARGKYRRTRPR